MRVNFSLREAQKVWGFYPEVVKAEKFIQIENFSLDFMVQNEKSFDDFRKGIIAFREGFFINSNASLGNFAITISFLRIGGGDYVYPLINNANLYNNNSAKFFDDAELNRWMLKEINKYLENAVAVEIVPGLVVRLNNGKHELVYSKSFMEANVK